MKFPPPRSPHHVSPSFALISVLALVSLAALTATAFLASARLERQATVSLTQSTVLEMALHAGVNCAKEMVDYAPSKHFNFVTTYWYGANSDDWTNELGYLLSGAVLSTSVKTSTIYNYYACFSTATMTNLGTTNTDLLVVSNNVNNQSTFKSQMSDFMARMTNFATNTKSRLRECTNIPLLGDSPTNRFTSPPVGWTYIWQDKRAFGTTNPTSVPVVRFAFYVQDLCGMIDAERMGGLNGGISYRSSLSNTLPTNYTPGTNPAEISLTNLTGTALIDKTNFTQFVASSNRIRYLSPGLLAEPRVGGLSSNDLRYVTTGLRHWSNAYERIPVGLGYRQSTELKTNLNTLINSNPGTAVGGIAALITNNLSNFKDRSGGMNSSAYVSNIAANIVDYIDTDSTPTVDRATNPTYLGIENLPWPNELFDRIGFAGVTSTGLMQLDLTDWVEVWNMGNKVIPLGTKVGISNNYDMVLTFSNTVSGSAFTTNLYSVLTNNNSLGMRDFSLPTNLTNNGYMVLPSSSANPTRRLGVQLTSPPLYATPAIRNAWKLLIRSNDETNKMKYQAFIYVTNSAPVQIQESKGGRWPRYLSGSLFQYNNGTPTKFIFCNPIGYASQDASMAISAKPLHSGGDPRAQLFLSKALRAANYINGYASCGGRNVEKFNIGTYPESEVNPSKYWPDSGHADPNDLGDGPKNNNATGYEFPPTNYPNKCVPENFVMVRNDSGKLTNIAELGNIYDPMQWSDQGGSGVTNQPGLWTNLTINATADTRYGGRNTLRIGRWEFSRFAFTTNTSSTNLPIPNMMISAAALMDLFSTSDQYDESGQINLNTAPAPVLRALAGDVYLRSDAALRAGQTNSGTKYSVPDRMVEAFAQGVMRFRSQYPFYSPSQLLFIGTDTNRNTWPSNSVFGNTNPIRLFPIPGNSYTSANLGISEWNDQAAEEWFAKIYKLSTTYSRNFRVYVVAQLVDSNKVGYGPVARKYYNVVTRQNTDKSTDIPPASASTFNSYESRY